jgi:hypothetical protein
VGSACSGTGTGGQPAAWDAPPAWQPPPVGAAPVSSPPGWGGAPTGYGVPGYGPEDAAVAQRRLARAKAARKSIVRGLVLVVVGLVIWIGSLMLAAASGGGTYVIAWGPVVFGLIRVVAGFKELRASER